jgi:hypothetical protein
MLDVGSYTLSITFANSNYTIAQAQISLTITERPTQTSVNAQPSTFNWGSSGSPTVVFYNETDNTVILASGVNITVMWLAQDPENSNFNVTISSYTYDHTGQVAPNGTWRLRFVFEKKNFENQQILTNTFNINEALTLVTWVGAGNETTVAYTQDATMEFYYNRTSPVEGAAGASIFAHNWTSTVTLVDLGNGLYRVLLGTTIEAENLTVSLTLGKLNHTAFTTSAKVNILIPLSIVPEEGASDQNPIEVYWTREFTLNVSIYDISRTSTIISGAIVAYDWNSTAFSGDLSENPGVSGSYNITLSASVTTPGLYVFFITAERNGALDAITSLYVLINPNPTSLSNNDADYPEYTVDYEDNVTITFYWNDTLDGVSLDTSNTQATLLTTATALVVDNFALGAYRIVIDTDALGLNVGEIYQISFSLNKTGYATPTEELLFLTLDPTETRLVLSLDNSDIEENQFPQVILTINYSRLLSGTGITNANLTVTFNGQSYTAVALGNGIYTLNLTTTALPRSTYQITVDATKTNYESAREFTNLVIVEPTIFIPGLGKVAVSTIVASAFTFMIPVVAVVGFIGYKRVTMPYPLKIINRALKKMQKGAQIDTEDLKLTSREATVAALLATDYEVLGLPLEGDSEETKESE